MAKKKRRAPARRAKAAPASNNGLIIGIAAVVVIILVFFLVMFMNNLAYMQGQRNVINNIQRQKQLKEAEDKKNLDAAVDTGKNVLAIYGLVRAVQDSQGE